MSHRDPSYRLHRQSGQAVVTLTDHLGRRKDRLLGKYDSDESWTAYYRKLAEWRTTRGAEPPKRGRLLTVDDLILRFWIHAEQHYRHPDGTPTSELHVYSRAVK